MHLFRAVYVMHKQLRGTFSSFTGSSISSGNVSTRGHVFDYETVQSPTLGDSGNLQKFQLTDLANAFTLLDELTRKLDRTDLLKDANLWAYLEYTRRDDTSADFDRIMEQMSHEPTLPDDGKKLARELASIAFDDAEWQ